MSGFLSGSREGRPRDPSSAGVIVVHGGVETRHELVDGDEVLMGNTRLRFQAGAVRSADLPKVSLAPDPGGTRQAEQVLAEETGEFLPAGEIHDESALRLDYERLRVGHEISRALASELDLRRLLPRILEKSLELLPADRAVPASPPRRPSSSRGSDPP